MNKIQEWGKEHFGLMIGPLIGLIVVVIIMYFATYQKETRKSDVQEVAATVPALTTEIMLDSMVRAWIDPKGGRFMKVCYDGPSKTKHGFFILYGPKNPSDAENTLDEGWWYVEQEFFMTGAGKYYTNDVPTLDRNQHVYPDVTGLNCKDRQ